MAKKNVDKQGHLKILSGSFMALVSLLLLFTAGNVSAIQPYNLPRGVTDVSQDIFDLHMLTFWVCVVIGIVVFGIMFWSLIFHRKSSGNKPAKFSHSTKFEVIWTVIPAIILVALMVPASLRLIDMHHIGEPEIDIKVTGYQWRWHYEYLGENVDFFSNLKTSQEQINNLEAKNENYLLDVDEEMVIPVDTRVRFLFTAADVLHAWWVPELSVKKDAIPGYINEAWTEIKEEGVYRGQCAELCGTNHGFMPIVVRAVAKEKYQDWLASRKKAVAEEEALAGKTDWSIEKLMERGSQVYTANCIACHQSSGQGIPPTFPALDGSSVVLGPAAAQINIMLNGVSGTTMSAFGALLSDNDIAAVITYTRNAWGNKGKSQSDLVSPQDVAAERK